MSATISQPNPIIQALAAKMPTSDILSRLRAAVKDPQYKIKRMKERLAQENLNPEPLSEDDDGYWLPDFDYTAMARYLDGCDDKALGWAYVIKYYADNRNIPQILLERIARIRKEIKQDSEWGIKLGRVHERSWLEYMLKCVTRHIELTNWLNDHQDCTILPFSTDPSDIGCYSYEGLDLDQNLDNMDAPVNFWLKHDCGGKVWHFNDPTLWGSDGHCSDTDRYYLAFEKRTDAEFFRLRFL